MKNENQAIEPAASDTDHQVSLQRLPVEVSLTIVGAGFVGLILPGPFGAPLIVGGGLSLWPKAFRPVDRWVRRRMPKAHASGMIWLDRFQIDLERRYPSE
ncbi:hypothetical protein GC170_07035 [bacterium]|nr:hypothetical protein [bacterium]